MTIAKLVVMLVCLMSVPLETKEAKVTPLLSKDLTDFPGKEGLMITVEYPPGSSDPIHRHNAHAFVYVLEGSIVMQVRGGKEVTLTPGQTFYEGPSDVQVTSHDLKHVFLMTGAEANTAWLNGRVALDAKGFIKTGWDLTKEDLAAARWPLDRSPQLLETSLPGVFAVGDVRCGSVKRVASAVGEGSISVSFVHRALAA